MTRTPALAACLLTCSVFVYAQAATNPADLRQARRIYVSQLTGGAGADALRELIISGIDSTKLFMLTDNPDRADAVLKGAADDHTFEDTFDSSQSLSTHENAGKSNAANSSYSSRSGIYGGISLGQNESHHIKERKHEAYASVRLCNKDGDVLWSTTQESLGAKFKGASADVASKVARQLSLDYERAARNQGVVATPASPAIPAPTSSSPR